MTTFKSDDDDEGFRNVGNDDDRINDENDGENKDQQKQETKTANKSITRETKGSNEMLRILEGGD